MAAAREIPAVDEGAKVVRATGLGRLMEDRQVLRDVDLDIGPGEIVAVLGANGAGKSTLLKILGTLLAPSSGKVELFGVDVRHGGAALRRRIGVIGHQTMLYPDLSALENLVFFGSLYGVKSARERGRELLQQLGLEARAADPVKEFSRGMAQRVAIARGLMHQPELLLADEPFAGLDAEATRILERAFADLAAAGRTIVLANHDVRQSLTLARRVVVLNRGRKVLDAPTATVDPERILAAMTGTQAVKEAVGGNGMNAFRQMMLIVGKDLRIEGRTRQTIGVVLVLGILIVSVLGMGLGSEPELARAGTPAILWVAYLFAGVLCFEKTMALERQEGALAGLLAAPVDRGVIFCAKLLANLILMGAVAAVVTAVGILFFQFDLSPAPWGFAGVIALSMVGFAAVGTLFSAVVSSTRLAGGLLTMVVFPLVLPLVISSTHVLTGMFEGPGANGLGIGILVAFDAIFLVVSWLAFEVVLEP